MLYIILGLVVVVIVYSIIEHINKQNKHKKFIEMLSKEYVLEEPETTLNYSLDMKNTLPKPLSKVGKTVKKSTKTVKKVVKKPVKKLKK